MRYVSLGIAVSALLMLPLLPSPGVADAWVPGTPVVIAVPDGGFNPYHEHFRRPDWVAHPSSYIPGYPEDAVALHLSLDAETLDEALAADHDALESMRAGQLYYIPGTNIVGVVSPDQLSINRNNWLTRNMEHGTSVASTAAGAPGQYPGAALVFMPYIGAHAQWLANQTWVDLASLSVACSGFDDGAANMALTAGQNRTEYATHLREFEASGRIRLQGAGNGPASLDPACGRHSPAWTVRVGGVSWLNGYPDPCDSCGPTPQILADLEYWTPPNASAMEGEHDYPEGGTSFSTPRAAGHLAELIDTARDALGWTGGFQDGLYAQLGPGATPPALGVLADGDLNRTELLNVYFRTATKMPPRLAYVPGTENHVPYDFLKEGYGYANDTTVAHAKRVLLGLDPMPERPWEDYWYGEYRSAMYEYWNGEECRRSSGLQYWASCPLPQAWMASPT